MNMFKSRRKAKDQSNALDTLTNEQPTTYRTLKNSKRKNKIMFEDPKPTFNLSTALPDDDNFRTSLLMTNLSARFSMLRDQDDPNTKLGKASDDSVLFPKRASRINLFNHNPLFDLAEVESIHSTFRPPFADRERSNSMGDGYDSDGGSIMSRSRHGEGNNLFGGRQRIYKISTTSTRSINTDGRVGGRFVYHHDASSSHFLPHKLKGLQHEEPKDSFPLVEEDSSDVASPATNFSQDRETQSSINSAPRRTSTAATSVASESAAFRNSNSTEEGVTTKSNDGRVPSPENSSISVSRARDDAIPNRFASQSKRSGFDRSQRPMPIYASTALRNANSPVVNVSQPLDFGFNTESRSNSATGRYQTESPTPSTTTESDEVLAGSVQPNDRGKATALGLFNKPAREFDEHQFNQRQLQMHENQVLSMSNGSRSTSRASNEPPLPPQNSVSATIPSSERTSVNQIPPIPSTPTSPLPNSNRASKISVHGTPPLRPRSKSATSITAVTSVKARIESLIRAKNAELIALEAEKLGGSNQFEDPSEDKENHVEPFFDNDDSDGDGRANASHVDESHIHPAFRNSYRVSDGHSRRSNYSNLSKTRSVVDDDRRDSSRLHVPTTTDSSNGIGLSGLIRTHLRQDSDKSSILPRPDSSLISPYETSQRQSTVSIMKTAADSSRSEPFDVNLDESPQLSQAPPTPTTAMSQVAQQFLARAKAINVSDQNPDKTEDVLTESKSWQDELEPRHQRGASSETAKERREFDEELAARRKKIQEGLKSVNERERSQSPAVRQSLSMQAFVQQRAVTDPQPKAIKMLGLQNRNDYSGTSDERGRMASIPDTRGHAIDTTFGNNQATFARFRPDTAENHPPRSATPPASRQGRRDRSDSNLVNRSRSRAREAPPVPSQNYLANQNPSGSNGEDVHKTSDYMSKRRGYQAPKPILPDLKIKSPTRSYTKPSPLSPSSLYESPADINKSSGTQHSGRTTPSSGRATPTNAFSRKKSVTKTMISEPTFLSSTSSVPLVHLPEAQNNGTDIPPPLPLMNPRRRENTIGDNPGVSPIGLGFSRSPLATVPASPLVAEFAFESPMGGPNSPSPRKLRKATSEGGSMAAKARQQAMAAELAEEQARSPARPIIPIRSTTAPDVSNDGGMF